MSVFYSTKVEFIIITKYLKTIYSIEFLKLIV